MVRTELRKWPRRGAKASLQVRWESSDGLTHTIRAQLLDVSPGGVALETTHRIPSGSQVLVQDARGGLGWARVRYCRDRRLRFVVGLELTSGTLLRTLLPPVEAEASRI